MLPLQKLGLAFVGIWCIFAIVRSGRVIPVDPFADVIGVDSFYNRRHDGVNSTTDQLLTTTATNESDAPPRIFLNGISQEAPLFSLGLPNSGSLALQRYFQCAGLKQGQELGWYFTNQREGTLKRELQEIGRCMHQNLQEENKPILQGCGKFQAWLDMDIARFKVCYYPSMELSSLEALFQLYPNATILQVRRDPTEWYKTLSYELRERWPTLCQANHPNVAFPGPKSSIEEWVQFYHWHVNHLRRFAKAHPSLRYIEINLDDSAAAATTLQRHLGVDPTCWHNSIAQPKLVPPRPNDITYPLLVAALSKSGTTTVHDYFTCGLGAGTSIHTWTKNSTTKQQMYLGQCLEHNIQQKRPLFKECSYYKVWTDIQYLTKPKGEGWSQGRCFFPTLEVNGGLQSFYQHYPYGTLLHVYRNASSWYRSTNRWMDLSERWARAKDCHGFPKPYSFEDKWIQFYHKHTVWVRHFAKNHPSLTYVEVDLEDPNTPRILEQVFGIPTHCWGISNVNNKKGKG